MYGSSSYGTTPYGSLIAPTGVTIIPEVALTTAEIVIVVEIALIRPQSASSSSEGSP